jgi:hypothetical protein
MTDSNRITRRDLIKTLTVAGAALAAAPLLAGVSTAAGAEGQQRSVALANENTLTSQETSLLASAAGSDEPLVLVVKNSEIRAFKGTQEFRFTDSALSSRLHSTLQRTPQ